MMRMMRMMRMVMRDTCYGRGAPVFSGPFIGHYPTRGPGQEVSKLSRVESGRVRGSHGSGRVKSFSNITGQAR